MGLYRQLLIFLLLVGNVFGQTGSIFVDENHNGHKIFGLPTPTAGNEAATKAYADSVGGGGGGAAAWGSITGTLSAQTDLQTALDNKQPIDADLTAIAALSGTHNIYYRSASNTWSSVTIGSGLDFTGATLSATSSGGNISNTGTPLDNQVAVFTDATHIEGNSNLSFDSSTNILSTGVVSPVTGFRINGAAANRRILVGNATNFVQSTETYAVPGTSGNVMQSDGTNWTSAQQNFSGLAGNWTLAQGPSITASKLIGRTDASAGIPQEITLGTNLAMSGTTLNATGGGSVSITATSPIVVTPTPLTGTGVVSLNAGVDLNLTAAQTMTVSDAINVVTDVLTLSHNTSASPSTIGAGLLFKMQDSTTTNTTAGELNVTWTTATHSSNVAQMNFRLTNGGLSLTTPATLSGTGILSTTLGYTVGGIATSGKILQGDGTKFTISTPKFPNSASSAGKIIIADGTDFVASTPTYPNAAGAVGYTVRSTGTNFASYPGQLINSSVTSQSPTTADVYLAGSNIVVTAGDFQAKGQYKCLFDMTKSAGTGAIVISVRAGINGTTADTAQLTFTFPAGTSVADVGVFEVYVTWRTVGSGTSAVMQGVCKAIKNTVTAAGMWGDTSAAKTIVATTSSGFASNTFTNIGVSFNGSTAFAGTATLVQAQLQQ